MIALNQDSSTTALGEMSVVPLDGMTVIDPQSGEAVSNKTNGKDWQHNNPVWDGRTIQLKGARREIINFQLIFLWNAGGFAEDIKIEFQAEGIEKSETWRAWCIWDVPEIAVPLEKMPTAFNLPSTLEIESGLFEGNRYQAWSAGIEFTIPHDAKAGNISGKVTVSAKKGMGKKEFPCQIEVYPFALPLQPSFVVEMNSYGDYLKFYPPSPEVFLGIHRLMREHRCSFVQVPYKQSGDMKLRFLAPQVSFDRAGRPDFDWSEFDSALSGLFDGSAFDDGQAISHFLLPFSYVWPIPFEEYQKNRDFYIEGNKAVRKTFFEHIRVQGWNQTAFQEFHNENPEAGAKCPWHLDEPRSPADMDGHEIFLDMFHSARTQKAPPHIRYRIDISNWQRLGQSLFDLAPQIDDWAVSRDKKYLNRKSAEMFRKLADSRNGMFIEYGEIAGFVAAGKTINWSRFDDYLKQRWELNIDGYEQWIIDMWKDKEELDHMLPKSAIPLFYSSAGGARDLIWPGESLGIKEPMPSIRLKAIRESLNLFDYLKMAEEAGLTEIGRMLEQLDSQNSFPRYKLKAKIAELIKQKKGIAT